MNDINPELQRMINVWEKYFASQVEFHKPIEYILSSQRKDGTNNFYMFSRNTKYFFEITDSSHNKRRVIITKLEGSDVDGFSMSFSFE